MPVPVPPSAGGLGCAACAEIDQCPVRYASSQCTNKNKTASSHVGARKACSAVVWIAMLITMGNVVRCPVHVFHSNMRMSLCSQQRRNKLRSVALAHDADIHPGYNQPHLGPCCLEFQSLAAARRRMWSHATRQKFEALCRFAAQSPTVVSYSAI